MNRASYAFNRYERLPRQVLVYKDQWRDGQQEWDYMYGRTQMPMLYPGFWPRPGR